MRGPLLLAPDDAASRDDVFRCVGVTPAVAPSTQGAGHDPVLRQPTRVTVTKGKERKLSCRIGLGVTGADPGDFELGGGGSFLGTETPFKTATFFKRRK